MRFSSVFNPRSVASVILRGWWRADTGVTVSGSGGVSQWDDLSDNNNPFVQATDGYRPLHEDNGYQGLPSIRFDGTNDFLSANGVAAFFTGNDIPMTMYLVYEYLSLAATQVIWRFETTAAATPYTQHYTSVTPNYVFDRNAAAITAGTPVINTKYIQRVFFAGTALTVIQNSTTIINNQSQNVASLALNLFTIGASNQQNIPAFWGSIRVAEMFLYSGRPTVTEDMLLANYLNNRYLISNG